VTRVGLGYDVHRFATGRPLVLGGINIPWSQGLDGHSDADVLTHAVMDALLGAAGLGDIGVHFPPSDEQWRDARSLDLLVIVRDLLPAGWTIENIDATILAEVPKIGPYREAMRAALSGALAIAPERVNIKATTHERMGFVGRGEGIAALASAALKPFGEE
jgi:2-C-methyl-D-erythritol 2,4-cyclodiphosphate synthase